MITATPVIFWLRSFASISSLTAGFSCRYWQAFALPWPIF